MRAAPHFADADDAALSDGQHGSLMDEWVQERLAQDFMRNAAATLRFGIVVLVLMLSLLWRHVDTTSLSLWAVLGVFVLSYRYYTVRVFQTLMHKLVIDGNTADISGFFRRHGWSWPASAIMFALPVFLYHEKVPPEAEYLCLMMLVGMGTTSAALMSANLKCQRAFSHALCATMLLAIAVHWYSLWPKAPTGELLVFLMLILLFWSLILYLGEHLHVLQRSGFTALFRNEQLIRSLRHQTLAANEAVQLKNNLLASATHDLRQPVHALAFYADWLRNEPQLAANVMPKILAATDSVNTLFNSLFDFARIESGAITITIGDVDFAKLVDEMVVQFAPAAEKKGLSLSAEGHAVMVRSDPVLLRRIASNLIANAIRYTNDGGVHITAKTLGESVLFEVSDSGVGISPEHLPNVFKEFYRAPGHTGTADSFGLGLAIVQRLCKALGHNVMIHSTVGKGTCCTIEIPVAHPNQSSRLNASAPLAGLDQPPGLNVTA